MSEIVKILRAHLVSLETKILVAMIAIQGTYAAICARDNKTGKYETLDSLEDMYSRNANGGR
ncbi:CLUMA_CG007787, isoform A [Clunio marinus]|uniref:CLUMA_CG007787, isoform A n=1 Tax=Clunio marinus TaxID=568069 RepID=A0A1J1I1R9_9DIPT|nr:CLUMA_CG007787, isoform A [Clunio marinus]